MPPVPKKLEAKRSELVRSSAHEIAGRYRLRSVGAAKPVTLVRATVGGRRRKKDSGADLTNNELQFAALSVLNLVLFLLPLVYVYTCAPAYASVSTDCPFSAVNCTFVLSDPQ